MSNAISAIRVGVCGLAVSQIVGCHASLLSEVYAVQHPVPDDGSPNAPDPNHPDPKPPQPAGAPKVAPSGVARMYACQDRQTGEPHWAPEYRFAFSFDRPSLDKNGEFQILQGDVEDKLSLDRALWVCSSVEYDTKLAAKGYEVGGFTLGILGAGGTAAFTGLAVKSGTGATDVGLYAAGAGLSAALTVVGGYLLARAADSWSGYGAANAAISQMKPNDPDGNWTLCSAALQTWAAGRAAADATVSSGGGGKGAGGGGGGAGAPPAAPVAPAPGGGGWTLLWPACPSDSWTFLASFRVGQQSLEASPLGERSPTSHRRVDSPNSMVGSRWTWTTQASQPIPESRVLPKRSL